MKYKNIILLLLVVTLFTACTSTKYVPVEVEKIKKEYINTLQIDTFYIKDSIFIQNKNDTVYLEKYKYVYKHNILRDTLIINDTIPTIKTVEVTKEVNRVYNWQIILMVLGGVFIAFLIFKLKSKF